MKMEKTISGQRIPKNIASGFGEQSTNFFRIRHLLIHFFLLLLIAVLAACGGGGSSTQTYKVSASSGSGGDINPASSSVASGATTSFTVTPNTGYSISGVTGCNGTLAGNTYTTGPITADCTVTASFSLNSYTVSASAGSGGSINPTSVTVNHGSTTDLTVTPDAGYSIATVEGCDGTLAGNTYTTGSITDDCTVTASFSLNSYTISATAGTGGSINPTSVTVNHGDTANFTVVVDAGYIVDNISGCGVSYLSNGVLNTYNYVTSPITADCTVTVSFGPNFAQPSLSYQAVKKFRFTWTDIPGASHYRLLEDPDGSSGYVQVSGDILPGTQVYDHAVNLHQRVNARYVLQTCFDAICQNSSTVMVDGPAMANAIGYFKASNTDGANGGDRFGNSLSISGDGNTLVVGAPNEDSPSTGINPADQTTNSQFSSGAVYVFTRDANGGWSQQAYIKASNAEGVNDAMLGWEADQFGYSTSLSNDGNTLVVGAPGEDSSIGGVNTPGAQADNGRSKSGAVYVFTRSGNTWTQQAYVKASIPASGENFGISISISSDGTRFAVGASGRFSGNGRVYLFDYEGANWSQQQVVTASNIDAYDNFGLAVALSGDGNTLAVGANREDSNAAGINGGAITEADNSMTDAGAAYVFSFDGSSWSQQAYIKASNPDAKDYFGHVVALNADGNILVVTATGEDSAGTGIDSSMQDDNSMTDAGAAYVFVRDAGGAWTQQAYIKASNTQAGDVFGGSFWAKYGSSTLGLSADGNTLVIGAPGEGGLVSGLQADQTDDNGGDNGAGYVFVRNGVNWTQQAYLKASNTGGWLGITSAISADGNTIVLGASGEGSDATGVGGDANNRNARFSGAVYMY